MATWHWRERRAEGYQRSEKVTWEIVVPEVGALLLERWWSCSGESWLGEEEEAAALQGGSVIASL